MSDISFHRVEYDHLLDRLADEVFDFVSACLDGVDLNEVRAEPDTLLVLGFYTHGILEALRGVAGECRVDNPVAQYIRSTLGRGKGDIAYSTWSGSSPERRAWLNHVEDDGHTDFMDWVTSPEGFRGGRLRRRIAELPVQS